MKEIEKVGQRPEGLEGFLGREREAERRGEEEQNGKRIERGREDKVTARLCESSLGECGSRPMLVQKSKMAFRRFSSEGCPWGPAAAQPRAPLRGVAAPCRPHDARHPCSGEGTSQRVKESRESSVSASSLQRKLWIMRSGELNGALRAHEKGTTRDCDLNLPTHFAHRTTWMRRLICSNSAAFRDPNNFTTYPPWVF